MMEQHLNGSSGTGNFVFLHPKSDHLMGQHGNISGQPSPSSNVEMLQVSLFNFKTYCESVVLLEFRSVFGRLYQSSYFGMKYREEILGTKSSYGLVMLQTKLKKRKLKAFYLLQRKKLWINPNNQLRQQGFLFLHFLTVFFWFSIKYHLLSKTF